MALSTSLLTTILTQVKDDLDGLEGDVSIGLTVVRRKRLLNHEGDTFPLAVVYPGPQREDEDAAGFEQYVLVSYPVRVGLILDGGQFVGGTTQAAMQDLRQHVIRTLNTPAAVALSEPVVGVSMNPDPPFDASAFRDNLDVSVVEFTYDVYEPRT